MKQTAPAATRNREPILSVLAQLFPSPGVVLEIASGTGEHAVHFARALPHLTWQPSDVEPGALASITAWRDEAALPNLRAPIVLDVLREPWPIDHADGIVSINLVHIAPWEATIALFAGAARLLAPSRIVYLYGPFRFGGAFTAPSNEAFDRSLRARDPRWGVRDVDAIAEAARGAGFALDGMFAMPANNHSIVFRRS